MIRRRPQIAQPSDEFGRFGVQAVAGAFNLVAQCAKLPGGIAKLTFIHQEPDELAPQPFILWSKNTRPPKPFKGTSDITILTGGLRERRESLSVGRLTLVPLPFPQG